MPTAIAEFEVFVLITPVPHLPAILTPHPRITEQSVSEWCKREQIVTRINESARAAVTHVTTERIITTPITTIASVAADI